MTSHPAPTSTLPADPWVIEAICHLLERVPLQVDAALACAEKLKGCWPALTPGDAVRFYLAPPLSCPGKVAIAELH